jgi:enterochelin esterase-like enzyme
MYRVKSYAVRGVREPIERFDFDGRRVDLWRPSGSQHLLVIHDGQNVFDRRTSTNGSTWRIAQTASRVFNELGLAAPTVVAVFHSGNRENPHGRALDLAPEDFFKEGMRPTRNVPAEITLDQLRGNLYLDQIYEEIVPSLIPDAKKFSQSNRALLGSSMGAIATLYEMGRKPERYGVALAYSPHWILVGDDLVRRMVQWIPYEGNHRIWMSRGTKKLDAEYEKTQNLADALLRERGFNGERLSSRIYRGAGHNEHSWSKQVADGLRFWLK